MDASILISLLGLVITTSNSAQAYKPQKLEGAKACEHTILKTLYSEKYQRLYVKYQNPNNTTMIFSMVEKPTNTGVRRFETDNGNVVFLQLPEKSMLLDNKNMKPIVSECRDV